MHTRYFNYIFTIFFNKKTTKEFNQKLKDLNQEFMFTIKSSTSNKLSFLDMNIKLEEN